MVLNELLPKTINNNYNFTEKEINENRILKDIYEWFKWLLNSVSDIINGINHISNQLVMQENLR